MRKLEMTGTFYNMFKYAVIAAYKSKDSEGRINHEELGYLVGLRDAAHALGVKQIDLNKLQNEIIAEQQGE